MVLIFSHVIKDVLTVYATTYKEAQPIVYSILEDIPYFSIDACCGVIRLISPFIDKVSI